MGHPSKEWKDEILFPEELKSIKRRYLDRDIRFSSVDHVKLVVVMLPRRLRSV